MQRIKNLIKQLESYKKYARDYTAKKDYYMANYYFKRIEEIERELEEGKIQKERNKRQERQFKNNNHAEVY